MLLLKPLLPHLVASAHPLIAISSSVIPVNFVITTARLLAPAACLLYIHAMMQSQPVAS